MSLEPHSMTPERASDLTGQRFEMLMLWSLNIALLPLKEWRRAVAKAEIIGPLIHPAELHLFRKTALFPQYLSEKPDVLKSILDAAIALQKAVLDAQPAIRRELEREASARLAE
jgi:hypothetical protein